MDQFLLGALAMGSIVVGLFFLRFRRDTGDRLFGLFALAFFIFAISRLTLAFFPATTHESVEHLYWIRFAGFVVILVAIWDKNRTRKH